MKFSKVLKVHFLLIFSQSIFCFNSKSSRHIYRLSPMALYSLHDATETIATCVLQPHPSFNVLRSLAAGSLAGGLRALSRGLTFPFDTMKTFEQAKGVEMKERTIGDYFRGVIPTVVTAIPANAFFFVTYDYLIFALSLICPCPSSSFLFQMRLLFSAIATLPQNAIKIPGELIKQRAQVQSESNFTLLYQQATATNGLQGLYLGGGAQLLREIPYNALQMTSFALLSDSIASYPLPFSEPLKAAMLGLFAAGFASVVTQPTDVIKTRIMTDLEEEFLEEVTDTRNTAPTDKTNKIPSTSTTTPAWWNDISIIKYCLLIIKEEGISGLYAGIVPRLLLVSIGGMVYFWAAAITDNMFDNVKL